MIKEFWNGRYAQEEYVFGSEPNLFFKSVIDTLPPGKILIPGAGEGRDAVYAAEQGFNVVCVDLSEEGRTKALRLAKEKNVDIEYIVCNIHDFPFGHYRFDAVGSTFFHLPKEERTHFYSVMLQSLKPGAVFFAEAYHPRQLDNTSGGPKDPDMLLTSNLNATELNALVCIINEECETYLNEGKGHVGKADVTRFVGKKK